MFERESSAMISRGYLLGWTFEIDRICRVLAIAREELAFRTLKEEDWLELSRSTYSRSAKYSLGSTHNESGLFAFEHNAIEKMFPAPPASLLVGGCGGGRELFALSQRGYRIAAAYDPVASFVVALRNDPRLVESKERICIGTHQELESMVPIAELGQREKHVDAVVVGWGSYTHILGKTRRIEFLRSLRALCPRGPVLLSFFVYAEYEAERPYRLRTTLRRLLGTTATMKESGDGLHGATGGIHCFTEAGFASEARNAGYRVQHWGQHEYGGAHAVLVPESLAESP